MTNPDIVQKMARQISEWEADEPREDWWNYQREYAEAAEYITTLRQQLAEAREALALMSPNWHPGDFA